MSGGLRHGKPVGFRYIMGANVLIGLSKSSVVPFVANVRSENTWTSTRERKSTGWDSNPRFRITGAESSPLNDQCIFLNGIRRTRTVGTAANSGGPPG